MRKQKVNNTYQVTTIPSTSNISCAATSVYYNTSHMAKFGVARKIFSTKTKNTRLKILSILFKEQMRKLSLAEDFQYNELGETANIYLMSNKNWCLEIIFDCTGKVDLWNYV